MPIDQISQAGIKEKAACIDYIPQRTVTSLIYALRASAIASASAKKRNCKGMVEGLILEFCEYESTKLSHSKSQRYDTTRAGAAP